MKPELTTDELARYARQLTLPGIGIDGQRRIAAARVLCIGAGGLGSPILSYLAAAGVGTIGIIDFDRVDASNLQRQIIHGDTSIGELKVDSAKAAIARLNPYINVITFAERLHRENVMAIFEQFDIIIDGTDNFLTRYLANDAAVLLGKPYIWGSIFQFDGQASTFFAEYGPCYRCLHPEPPAPGSVPSCSVAGVLGALCGTIGTLQATEALKLITGFGEPLIGSLLTYGAESGDFEKIELKKNPNCPLCSAHPTQLELLDSYEDFCRDFGSINVTELLAITASARPITLIDVREPDEWDAGRIEGAIHIPLAELLAGRGDEIMAKSPEVVFYCRSGKRSNAALAYARKSGIAASTHLAGGILAYLEQTSK